MRVSFQDNAKREQALALQGANHLNFSAILLALLVLQCTGLFAADPAPLSYATTIRPIAMILKEIAGDRASVTTLLPPGASPHSYDPRPSEVRAVGSAAALFYVSPLLDEWAAALPAKKKIRVFDLIPEPFRLESLESQSDFALEWHFRFEFDPHFWTDPLTVRAVMPALAKAMGELDPAGAAIYEANAARFALKLDELDAKLADLLAPVKGKPAFLYHPSFQYLLHHYGIVLAGVIEPSPGREPTPKDFQSLAKKFKETGAKAVFTEPQSSPRPAAIFAETVGAPLYQLDPIGGSGIETYEQLLLSNAEVLLKALR